MARINRLRAPSSHRIAIVEDDDDLRDSLAQLFTREGHEVRTARTVDEAIELVAAWRPHLMLLDYFLEHDAGSGTGAEVVRAIRDFEAFTQVLLVTGYADENPARTLLRDLDIQGYHDKSDGPARLMVLADAALKHYRVVASLERQRRCLRHILEVSSDINKLQAPRELLHAALDNAARLLSAGQGVIATSNNGLFVLGDRESEEVAIHAASGQFSGARSLRELPEGIAAAIRDGMVAELPYAHPGGFVIIPLETRDHARGCMVIETSSLPKEVVEACQIFAGQVVQALENVMLYERATVDSLTRVYNRGHGLDRLQEMLRLAARIGDPTSLLLIDVDHFKALNDTYGHAAGDLALRRIAGTLRGTCRTSDVVARFGGEEFIVALPATDSQGAMVAADKLRRAVKELEFAFEGALLEVTVSIGVAAAAPGDFDAAAICARADAALYRAKRDGRDCIRDGEASAHGTAHASITA